MAGGEPEEGDKVSWSWGGGAPGGTVVEKKTKGEIAITSKRGNVIKKNASPDNPGIHIGRSGNDVVKRASELTIEKKASGGDGKKRSHEESGTEDGDATVQNKQGKEVRPGGKKAKKEDTEAEEAPKTDGAPKANEKKKAGRPTGNRGGGKKEKDRKPRSTEGISSRTRSRK